MIVYDILVQGINTNFIIFFLTPKQPPCINHHKKYGGFLFSYAKIVNKCADLAQLVEQLICNQ